jgi:hypothetical protein
MGLLEHVIGQLERHGHDDGGHPRHRLLGYLLSPPGVSSKCLLLCGGDGGAAVRRGTIGVPYAVGSWITSLSPLSLLLATYYGYRASRAGLRRLPAHASIGFIIAFATMHLVVYGIVVTDGLGISSYYHAPGTLQPQGVGVRQNVEAHLKFSPVLIPA